MSNEELSLEKRIENLKKRINDYEQMDENSKISNVQEYKEIQKEKDICSTIIDGYKQSLNDPKTKKDNKKKQTNDNISELLNKMYEIKKIIEGNNLEVDKMVTYYQELCNIRNILNDHFKNKKMEIVNI
ncbi:hypothetical protein QKU48_gp0237 [Fadolivirus algeromassiliense]|jgi:cell division septum initiation protein DivIVA|uniref:Uncharacterized protein n=1 Tax=Fadolivirus FV1/VV64 TaxID=3070911 RepID=A0A7D3V590_9VIRU|nr:hypothetical protein QKU48_gp0237 [Fadolivirus algeromassiliense]QKF93695.1 hypothetical protein Fadolivirus_1_237 [Fadolivirus FV1/VV64]